MPIVTTVLGSVVAVSARPAAVFIPHLERIQSKLPSGLVMRLPAELPLTGHSDIEDDKLIVRVFPSETPRSFTIGVFTCESSPYPCLLGSFSVASKTTASAKLDLQRHQNRGDRITLVTKVKGYLLEGPRQNPPYQFSTIMWQQGDMIYTVSFPASERQSILRMAISMAREQPFYPIVSPSVLSSIN